MVDAASTWLTLAWNAPRWGFRAAAAYGSESSSGIGLNSPQGGVARTALHRFTRALFGVLFVMARDTSAFARKRWHAAVLMTMDFVSLVGFALAGTAALPWHRVPTMSAVSSVSQVLSLGSVLGAEAPQTLRLITFTTGLVLIALIVACAVTTASAFANARIGSFTMGPVRFLRGSAQLVTTAVYIPLASSLIQVLQCPDGASWLGQGAKWECWGWRHSILSSAVLLALVMFLLLTAVCVAVFFNRTPSSRNVLSRAHGRVHVAMIVVKTVLPLVYALDHAVSATVLVAVCLASGFTWFGLYATYLPYHDQFINRLQCGFAAVHIWATLCLGYAVMYADDVAETHAAAKFLIIGAPFAAASGFAVAASRFAALRHADVHDARTVFQIELMMRSMLGERPATAAAVQSTIASMRANAPGVGSSTVVPIGATPRLGDSVSGLVPWGRASSMDSSSDAGSQTPQLLGGRNSPLTSGHHMTWAAASSGTGGGRGSLPSLFDGVTPRRPSEMSYMPAVMSAQTSRMVPPSVAQAGSILQQGLLAFPRSAYLRIFAAQFYSEVVGDFVQEQEHLLQAARWASWIDEAFLVFQREQAIEDEVLDVPTSPTADHGPRNVVARLQVELYRQRAVQMAVNTKRAQVAFWRELMRDSPNLGLLSTLASTIHRVSTTAEHFLQRLLQVDPGSITTLRLYAEFLQHVLHDDAAAQRPAAAADALERATCEVSDCDRRRGDDGKWWRKFRLMRRAPAPDMTQDSIGLITASRTQQEDGIITAANSAVLEALGYTTETLCGTLVRALCPRPFSSAKSEVLWRYVGLGSLLGDATSAGDARFSVLTMADTSLLPAIVLTRPLGLDGGVVMAVQPMAHTWHIAFFDPTTLIVTSVCRATAETMGVSLAEVGDGDVVISNWMPEVAVRLQAAQEAGRASQRRPRSQRIASVAETTQFVAHVANRGMPEYGSDEAATRSVQTVLQEFAVDAGTSRVAMLLWRECDPAFDGASTSMRRSASAVASNEAPTRARGTSDPTPLRIKGFASDGSVTTVATLHTPVTIGSSVASSVSTSPSIALSPAMGPARPSPRHRRPRISSVADSRASESMRRAMATAKTATAALIKRKHKVSAGEHRLTKGAALLRTGFAAGAVIMLVLIAALAQHTALCMTEMRVASAVVGSANTRFTAAEWLFGAAHDISLFPEDTDSVDAVARLSTLMQNSNSALSRLSAFDSVPPGLVAAMEEAEERATLQAAPSVTLAISDLGAAADALALSMRSAGAQTDATAASLEVLLAAADASATTEALNATAIAVAEAAGRAAMGTTDNSQLFVYALRFGLLAMALLALPILLAYERRRSRALLELVTLPKATIRHNLQRARRSLSELVDDDAPSGESDNECLDDPRISDPPAAVILARPLPQARRKVGSEVADVGELSAIDEASVDGDSIVSPGPKSTGERSPDVPPATSTPRPRANRRWIVGLTLTLLTPLLVTAFGLELVNYNLGRQAVGLRHDFDGVAVAGQAEAAVARSDWAFRRGAVLEATDSAAAGELWDAASAHAAFAGTLLQAMSSGGSVPVDLEATGDPRVPQHPERVLALSTLLLYPACEDMQRAAEVCKQCAEEAPLFGVSWEEEESACEAATAILSGYADELVSVHNDVGLSRDGLASVLPRWAALQAQVAATARNDDTVDAVETVSTPLPRLSHEVATRVLGTSLREAQRLYAADIYHRAETVDIRVSAMLTITTLITLILLWCRSFPAIHRLDSAVRRMSIMTDLHRVMHKQSFTSPSLTVVPR